MVQHDKLLSKGFYEPVTIQDFPLRGKACYLKVKRRRWQKRDDRHYSDAGLECCSKRNTNDRGNRVFFKST
ncbi:MAG: ISAon1 family transposase N-terminal region protein [Selenomonadaceae bacterium]